jgi:hypothetical protein
VPQHMVIFQNPDGDTGYNQFDSIDGAVSFVEKIRNDQGIDSIRIFELEEVKFDLKPYYRVELQALRAGSPSAATPQPSFSDRPAPAPQPSFAESPAPAPAEAAPIPAEPAPVEPAPAPPQAEPAYTSPFAPPAAASSFPPPQAPVPPADQPEEEPQPTRRGLFGR